MRACPALFVAAIATAAAGQALCLSNPTAAAVKGVSPSMALKAITP
jgi:hypothetical protein